MKYYSDVLNKVFDKAEDCIAAEREHVAKQQREKEEKEKKANARKAAANKVEAARKVMVEAQDNYRKELEAFCKEYGAYHYSATNAGDIPHLFDQLFDIFS